MDSISAASCLVDQTIKDRSNSALPLMDRAVSQMLQLHVGTPVLHMHGQQLYYAAACLLRRGAAVKKTAGHHKPTPLLV